MLLRTPEYFLEEVGHFSDLELKKSGTENAHPQTKRFVEPCCRSDDSYSQWKADIFYSEEQVRCSDELWKAKEVKDHEYTTTQIQRQQSCHFAVLFPSIRWVSTEQQQTGVRNLLSRFQIVLHPVQGILWAAQGNLVQQHRERFGNVPEDIRVILPIKCHEMSQNIVKEKPFSCKTSVIASFLGSCQDRIRKRWSWFSSVRPMQYSSLRKFVIILER